MAQLYQHLAGSFLVSWLTHMHVHATRNTVEGDCRLDGPSASHFSCLKEACAAHFSLLEPEH